MAAVCLAGSNAYFPSACRECARRPGVSRKPKSSTATGNYSNVFMIDNMYQFWIIHLADANIFWLCTVSSSEQANSIGKYGHSNYLQPVRLHSAMILYVIDSSECLRWNRLIQSLRMHRILLIVATWKETTTLVQATPRRLVGGNHYILKHCRHQISAHIAMETPCW